MSASFLEVVTLRAADVLAPPPPTIPPPTFPSPLSIEYVMQAIAATSAGDVATSERVGAQFLSNFASDVMSDVGLHRAEIPMANGWVAKYWIREGAPQPAGASRPPAIVLLPGLREKVYPLARLVQTLGMPESSMYILELPTCGGHCLPVVPDPSTPVPAGAFASQPVRMDGASELLSCLLSHLNLGGSSSNELILIGYSTGGHLAYTFAARHAASLPGLRGIGLVHPAGHCLSGTSYS